MKLTDMTIDQLQKEKSDARAVADMLESIIRGVNLFDVNSMRQLLDCLMWFEKREKIVEDILSKRTS